MARASGIPISDGAVAYALEQTEKEHSEAYGAKADPPFVPVHFKPSMLVDLEAGRPMEVEGIIGTVVKKAKQHGISVPRYIS